MQADTYVRREFKNFVFYLKFLFFKGIKNLIVEIQCQVSLKGGMTP